MIRLVEFQSPGTFLAESNFKKIFAWTKKGACQKALKESKDITQRHGAHPYAFIMGGITYYLPHCEVTLAKNIPVTDDNRILISNCLGNGFKAIVTPKTGWQFTRPFTDTSVLLDENGKIKLEGKKL